MELIRRECYDCFRNQGDGVRLKPPVDRTANNSCDQHLSREFFFAAGSKKPEGPSSITDNPGGGMTGWGFRT